MENLLLLQLKDVEASIYFNNLRLLNYIENKSTDVSEIKDIYQEGNELKIEKSQLLLELYKERRLNRE